MRNIYHIFLDDIHRRADDAEVTNEDMSNYFTDELQWLREAAGIIRGWFSYE